jgi:hypothetical protein
MTAITTSGAAAESHKDGEPLSLAHSHSLSHLSRRRPGFVLDRKSSKRRLCEISTSKSTKTVHFATSTSTACFRYDPLYSDEDRPLLWYSRDEFRVLEAQSQQECQAHLVGVPVQPSKEATALQQLYSQCMKTAAKRGSGVHKTVQESSPTSEISLLSIRGLETGLIPDVAQRRRQAVQKILTTQQTMANAHPSIRERAIGKTAEHLSRVAVVFALRLAEIDAQQA